MGESEKIVYRTREVTMGDGALKVKPEKENPLLNGTSDEAMIQRELEEAAKSENSEKAENGYQEPQIQEEQTIGKQQTSPEEAGLEDTLTRMKVSELNREDYINGFRIVDHIGSGGISEVYLVEQPSTGARFAYKMLSREKTGLASQQNPEAPRLFLEVLRGGAGLAAKLGEQYPEKFPAFAIDYTHSDSPGILTQFVPNSLEERIDSLSEDEKIRYIFQAAEEIKILHDNQVVLADIKPSQFRIDDRERLKLVDLDSKHSDSKYAVSSLIQSIAHSQIGRKTGIIGTPRYMAPEQWDLLEGKEAVIDKRTDVFGLASMIYEIATGEKPEGSHEKIQGRLSVLDDIIIKARSRRMEDRFASAGEFLEEVRKTLGQNQDNDFIHIIEKPKEDIGLIKGFDETVKASIFSYDGENEEFYQELIAKVNEKFKWTKAEIPIKNGGFLRRKSTGQVKNMHILKRLALITTIADDPQLRSANLWPITPLQSEILLQIGGLGGYPSEYWEDLGLILYDKNQYGMNPREARFLYESLAQNKQELGLSQSDLSSRLLVVNAGLEVDGSIPHGVRPIVIPGVSQIYHPKILENTGKNYNFEYGLDNGVPKFDETGKGGRTICMPSEIQNLGLRVLVRSRYSDLNARCRNLVFPVSDGRVNFVPQAPPQKKYENSPSNEQKIALKHPPQNITVHQANNPYLNYLPSAKDLPNKERVEDYTNIIYYQNKQLLTAHPNLISPADKK